MTLLAIFGGAQLIVLAILLTLTIFFLVRAYISSRSGSRKQDRKTGKYEYSDENVPIVKTGYFKLFLIALLATIAAVIEMISEA